MRRRSEGKKNADTALSPPPAPPSSRRTSRRRKSNLSDDDNVVLADLKNEKSSGSEKKREKAQHVSDHNPEEAVEGKRRRSHRNRTPVTERYSGSSKRSSRSNRGSSSESRNFQSIPEERGNKREDATPPVEVSSNNDRTYDNEKMSEKQLRKMMIEQLQETETQEPSGKRFEKSKVMIVTDSPSTVEEKEPILEKKKQTKELTVEVAHDKESVNSSRRRETEIRSITMEKENTSDMNDNESLRETNLKSLSTEEINISPKDPNTPKESVGSKSSSPVVEGIKDQEMDKDDTKDSTTKWEVEEAKETDDSYASSIIKRGADAAVSSEDEEELNDVKVPSKKEVIMEQEEEEENKVATDVEEEGEEKVVTDIEEEEENDNKAKDRIDVDHSPSDSVEINAKYQGSFSDDGDEEPRVSKEKEEIVTQTDYKKKTTNKSNSTDKEDDMQDTEDASIINNRSDNEGRCPSAEEEEMAKEEAHCKTEVKIVKDLKPIDSSNAAALDTGRLRKRRWMTKKATECNESVLAISTDSLKTLIADVLPVPLSDVQLESSSEAEEMVNLDHEEGEKSSSSGSDTPNNWESNDKHEKDAYSSLAKPQLKTQTLNEKNIAHAANCNTMGPGATAAASGLGVTLNVNVEATASSSQTVAKATPQKAIGASTNTVQRSPSPARHQTSNVLYITNLVRPFTLLQLKGLLARTGKILENGFWIDRIKSKCYVEYETEDEAIETRHALHGVRWPSSNPKCLNVDFGDRTDMLKAIEATKEDNYKYGLENNKDNVIVGSGWSGERAIENRKTFRPIREWDMGKKEHLEHEKDLKEADKHARDGNEKNGRESTKETKGKDADHGRNGRPGGGGDNTGDDNANGNRHSGKNRARDQRSGTVSPARKLQKKEEPLLRLLDDLFRKTKATPYIYWLPLTPEQIAEKEILRQKRLEEQKIRLKQREMEREKERSRQHARERERSHRRNRSSDRRRSRSRDRRRY